MLSGSSAISTGDSCSEGVRLLPAAPRGITRAAADPHARNETGSPGHVRFGFSSQRKQTHGTHGPPDTSRAHMPTQTLPRSRTAMHRTGERPPGHGTRGVEGSTPRDTFKVGFGAIRRSQPIPTGCGRGCGRDPPQGWQPIPTPRKQRSLGKPRPGGMLGPRCVRRHKPATRYLPCYALTPAGGVSSAGRGVPGRIRAPARACQEKNGALAWTCHGRRWGIVWYLPP